MKIQKKIIMSDLSHDGFKEQVKIKNPNEPEFLQAVEEVVENIVPMFLRLAMTNT